MKAPVINIFNKKKQPESAKPFSEHSPLRPKASSTPAVTSIRETGPAYKTMPAWPVVGMAYVLAGIFWYFAHQFFIWIPPYLREVFQNLHGIPTAWVDAGLLWAERGLVWVAVAAALYHHFWQLGTRYRLTPHDIKVETWFPLRRIISIPYGSVRRVGFQQTVLGLLFRYGHVEIDTGSPAGPLLLLNCPKPQKFVGLLQPKVEAVLQPGLSRHRRAGDHL